MLLRKNPGRYVIRHDRLIETISADALPVETSKQQEEEHEVDTEKPGFNVGERLEYARECSGKLDLLCRWTEGEATLLETGFAGDRSRAESSLAWHLAFWFERNETAVKHMMNRLNPPKWSEEGPGYRESTLEAIKYQPDTFGGNKGESNPSIELVFSVWLDLYNKGSLKTAEVCEIVGYGQTQTRKALNFLKEKNLVGYKSEGRSGKWHAKEGMENKMDEIEDELNSLDDRDRYLSKRNQRIYGKDSRSCE